MGLVCEWEVSLGGMMDPRPDTAGADARRGRRARDVRDDQYQSYKSSTLFSTEPIEGAKLIVLRGRERRRAG